MGKIRKILETELVGGTQNTDVYPVTSTKAVYDTDNKVLDNYIQHLKKTSTFAGIATPITNPGTPNGNVFYIAGEGTYINFSNLVIGVGQLGILKWDGTWSKQVLEIGAGGGSGGGGGVVDTATITKVVNDTIKNVSWWGQKINNNKVDGNIVITKGSRSFNIELDDNGNLKFNGNIYATGGITALGVGTTTGGGSGVSLGTLLTKLNSDNPFPTANGQVLTYDGTNFVWKTPTGSGGSLNSLEVLNKDGSTFFNYNGETAYRLRFGNGLNMSLDGDEYVVKAMGGTANLSEYSWWGRKFDTASNSIIGEMSSVTSIEFQSTNGETVIKKKLHIDNNGDLCFDGNFYATGGITAFGNSGSISGGGSDGSGVTLSPVMNAMNNQLGNTTPNTPQFLYWDGSAYTWKNESEISGSGGSTSTSVSWTDVTNKPSTFTPSSHTHSTSEINGLSNYVQGVKVSNATNADKATQLANSRTIWGQSFNGTSNINGNLYMGSAGGGSIHIWMNNGNMLERTNNILHIGNGLKASSDGWIYLDAYATKVYTDNMSKHYDFKSNVFDVNSNQIHFGTDSNGGTLSWDSANKCFKIDGSIYATGGITALGVSNNTTTSNNVDFTFRSVTANTFNVMNSIQLSDNLKLTRDGNNINLVNTNSKNEYWLYINSNGLYGLSSDGNVYANNLECDTFSFGQADNFEIINANDRSFTIRFIYNGKTYLFTPSESDISIN